MSDRKRKAAICCLVAASLLFLERKKKRKLEDGVVDSSKSLYDTDNTSDYDEDEEPNYETSNYSDTAIKVEPGLVEEDSISEHNNCEYDPLKEDIKDPLDISDMIDIDTSNPIKQESFDNYESSLDAGISIKKEPEFSDEYGNSASSQYYLSDSSEGCSQSNSHRLSFFDAQRKMSAEKGREMNNVSSLIKNPNEVKDEFQVFGDFVAEGMRNLKREENRKKLKRIVQNVLSEISKTECY